MYVLILHTQYGYILPEKEKLNFKIYFRRNPGMILRYTMQYIISHVRTVQPGVTRLVYAFALYMHVSS